MYRVYILRCADDTLYCGIATDVDRRVIQHNTTPSGAKYTRMRRPVVLVYTSQPFINRSQASIEEHRIKKLSRAEKVLLLQG